MEFNTNPRIEPKNLGKGFLGTGCNCNPESRTNSKIALRTMQKFSNSNQAFSMLGLRF